MTAPDRIAPDRITVARRFATRLHDVMNEERTMSHGYVDAVEYVRADVVDELAQALEGMAERYILYAGGSDMPFAGDKEVTLLETARAALARYRGGVTSA